MKYVIVSGGVVSGLGKGITASSIGLLLKESGLAVTSIKIDPYLNIDAGTMSPYEHGEVFVLDDGGEADLDLGNYERFLDVTLSRDHNITTGKIYNQVLQKERRGDYLGKTVQVVPHITDGIQDWIDRVSQVPVTADGRQPDVCIVELGGTVGDIESMIFLEALRQFEFRVGRDNFCHVHVTLVPVVGAVGEQKSKPCQHGVRELRSAGLLPNMIVARSSEPLSRGVREKISMFSMVPSSHVFSVHDVNNIYQVPGMLLAQRVPALVLSCLHLNKMPPEAVPMWDRIGERVQNCTAPLNIALVGKYTGLSDSYLSVIKAMQSAAIGIDRKLHIEWVKSEHLSDDAKTKTPEEHEKAWNSLKSVDGILIPGGFGDRGVGGKILAAKYARENKVPFLGICLGMQVAVIEFARNVVGIPDAHSSELNPDTKNPVILFMPEISTAHMGGNMRLGSRVTNLRSGSLAQHIYDSSDVHERHRHRYEVNPDYVDRIEANGLVFSGRDTTGMRMECVEIDDHPYYLGVQFHPEFKSRPLRPSPPFLGLMEAAAGLFDRRKNKKLTLPPTSPLRPARPSKDAPTTELAAMSLNNNDDATAAHKNTRPTSSGKENLAPL